MKDFNLRYRLSFLVLTAKCLALWTVTGTYFPWDCVDFNPWNAFQTQLRYRLLMRLFNLCLKSKTKEKGVNINISHKLTTGGTKVIVQVNYINWFVYISYYKLIHIHAFEERQREKNIHLLKFYSCLPVVGWQQV